jgi:hypothetical protein
MLELEVILEFCCCLCRHALGATVKCAGKGLQAGAKARAAATIACPTCGKVNRVVFAPDGTLHHLAPHETPRLPEPSLN